VPMSKAFMSRDKFRALAPTVGTVVGSGTPEYRMSHVAALTNWLVKWGNAILL
jgi:hypothetical protein